MDGEPVSVLSWPHARSNEICEHRTIEVSVGTVVVARRVPH
jgi:hypothetical protein